MPWFTKGVNSLNEENEEFLNLVSSGHLDKIF